jgi:hypothetical protein
MTGIETKAKDTIREIGGTEQRIESDQKIGIEKEVGPEIEAATAAAGQGRQSQTPLISSTYPGIALLAIVAAKGPIRTHSVIADC